MATSGTGGISACVSLTIIGGPPQVSAGVFAPAPVHVERVGDSVRVTPDDPSATFRMQLQVAGANLSGTASGEYLSGGTPVRVSGRTSGTGAVVTGIVGGTAASASGALDGNVGNETMTCFNNGHAWSLKPR